MEERRDGRRERGRWERGGVEREGGGGKIHVQVMQIMREVLVFEAREV